MSSMENFVRDAFFGDSIESFVAVALAGMLPGELVVLTVLEFCPLSSKRGDDGGCSLKSFLRGS